MARPIGGRLSEVFRQAYSDAGLTQTDIETRLHERGFTNIDQPLVSKWARGMRPIPLDLLPALDEILGQGRGYLLRLAGYVEDLTDVVTAINSDPHLDDAAKKVVIGVYEGLRKMSAIAPIDSNTPTSPAATVSARAHP